MTLRVDAAIVMVDWLALLFSLLEAIATNIGSVPVRTSSTENARFCAQTANPASKPTTNAPTLTHRSMSNPHALTEAQDDAEVFEVMAAPPSYFDLLRDKPSSTGRRKLRKDVHRDGDWHCSAHVWLIDAQRRLIAVQKRSASKDTFPSRWDISAAGHIEVDCDPLTTAVRELAEELGIDNIKREAFKFGFICPAEQKGWGGCNAYEHVYFVEVDSASCPMNVGGAEVTDVKWIAIEELEQKLRQRDDEYLPRVDAYIETFFGYLDKL